MLWLVSLYLISIIFLWMGKKNWMFDWSDQAFLWKLPFLSLSVYMLVCLILKISNDMENGNCSDNKTALFKFKKIKFQQSFCYFFGGGGGGGREDSIQNWCWNNEKQFLKKIHAKKETKCEKKLTAIIGLVVAWNQLKK